MAELESGVLPWLVQLRVEPRVIRVERAHEPASYLLSGPPGASVNAIDRAIASGYTQRVPVAGPLPVYVYWTAFVDDAGTIQFRDDVSFVHLDVGRVRIW